MIGFDRPLRPTWIYETLKIIKVGISISECRAIFEGIAKELTGKEGKDKVRIILFRSFILSAQNGKTIMEDTIFMKWARVHKMQFLLPLFFAKLLMDYDVLRFSSAKVAASVDNQGHINTKHFMSKFIQEYGDRDVVRRSLRSFLTTLKHFNLANELSLSEIVLLDKFKLTNEQTRLFLQLYSIFYLKSKMIDLKELDNSITMYYSELPIQSTAKEFNGIDWEYIREPSREILLMK